MFKKAMTSFKIVGSFLMISFFIVISSAQAQDSLHVDTLVAYYPFSGSAMDSSGFANDGEVFGATLTEDRFGNPNSAYAFDGYDDFIEIADDTVFSSESKTIEFWFKKDINSTSASDVEGIIWKALNTGIDRVFSFSVTNQNLPYDFYSNTGNLSDTLVHAITEQSIYPGLWYQGVGVIDSSMVKLYLNGVLVDSVVNNGGVVNNSAPIAIGKSQGYVPSFEGGTRHFEGVIDDVSIYNYALTDSAIQELYTRGGWPLPQDTTAIPADTLIAYYPFSGSAMDSSGFGNDGEVYGATLTEDRFGNPNSAYSFDGYDDFIEIADDTVFNSQTKTIEFWFKKDNDSISESTNDIYAEGIIWKAFDTGLNLDFTFSLTNENAPFNIANTIGNGSDSIFINRVDNIIEPTQWYHIVGIVSPENTALYINGLLESTLENEGGVINSSAPITIGKIAFSPYSARHFKGSVDDIKIYNYELSSTQVLDSYTQGGWPLPEDTTAIPADTLIAYYPFSGSAMDSSGFANDGEVFGATLTEDRFGNPNSAYAFDGVDDYINTNTTFNYPNRSISVWVKVDYDESTVQNRQTILEQDSGHLTYGAMGLYFRNQMFDFRDGNTEDTWPQPALQKDTWSHLTMTRSDTVVKGYLNGQLVGIGIADNNGSFSNPFNEVRIGANREWNLFLKGAIDDISFYNYALSDSAIQKLYTKGGWPLPEDTTAVLADTLVAYYPFSGSAMDSSGFGNNGEVFGATLTEDRFGNPNSAYAFDGSNDFIEISDNMVFNSQSKTIEFWFKKDINSTSSSDVEGIIWKALNTGTDRVFSYTVTNKNSPYDFYSNSGNQTDLLVRAVTEQSIYPGRWYQGVGVIDSSVVKLYLNGVLVDSVVHNGGIVNNSAPIVIGKTQGFVPGFAGGTRHFEGAIDDVQIYNYALSDSAIHKNYTRGGWPGLIVPPDAMVAYYTFDGDTLDHSGYDNQVAVYGASLTKDRNEKPDQSFLFDGENDYIKIANPSGLSSLKNLSVSFWATRRFEGYFIYRSNI